MIYIKLDKEWFKTTFRNLDDISIVAFEHSYVLVDTKQNTMISPYSESKICYDAIMLEIWMFKDTMKRFKENEFIKDKV